MENILNHCRLCCVKLDDCGINLFHDKDDNINHSKDILDYLRVPLINRPEWPSKSCQKCMDFVSDIKTFKKNVLASQTEFINWLPPIQEPKTTSSHKSRFDKEESEDTDTDNDSDEDVIERRDSEFEESQKSESMPIPSTTNSSEAKSENTEAKTSDSNQKEWVCPICKKTCRNRFSIYRHKRLHSKKPYLCDIDGCTRVSETREMLKKHQMKKHKPVKKVMLRQKSDSSNEQINWTCDICDKILTSSSGFRIHKLIHIARPFLCKFGKCRQCKNQYVRKTGSFETDELLKEHAEKHESTQAPKPPPPPKEPVDRKKQEHVCHFCAAEFTDRIKYNTHLSKHKTSPLTKCPICGKLVIKLSIHMRIHDATREKFQCPECGKLITNRPSNIEIHLATHREPTHQCPHCPKKFNNKQVLRRHIANHQGVEFSCEYCPKKFSYDVNRISHMKADHKEEYLAFLEKRQEERINKHGIKDT